MAVFLTLPDRELVSSCLPHRDRQNPQNSLARDQPRFGEPTLGIMVPDAPQSCRYPRTYSLSVAESPRIHLLYVATALLGPKPQHLGRGRKRRASLARR